MLYGDVVINVNSPTLKNDRFVVLDANEVDNEKYEFIYNFDTKMQKMDKFDAKKILECTYNLGKMLDTFCYEYEIPNKENNNTITCTSNIFIEASNKANYLFYASIKSRYLEFTEKHNIEIQDINNNSNIRQLFLKEGRLIQKDLYNNELEKLFKKHNIKDKDKNKLFKAIKKWVKTCGLTENELEISKKQLNIFPIVIFCYKIYSIIKNENIDDLEVNINYKVKKDIHNAKADLYVDTFSDLIYLYTMNYFIFNKTNYIFCEVCGNMATGKSSKKYCSERCKKISNGVYPLKKSK